MGERLGGRKGEGKEGERKGGREGRKGGGKEGVRKGGREEGRKVTVEGGCRLYNYCNFSTLIQFLYSLLRQEELFH